MGRRQRGEHDGPPRRRHPGLGLLTATSSRPRCPHALLQWHSGGELCHDAYSRPPRRDGERARGEGAERAPAAAAAIAYRSTRGGALGIPPNERGVAATAAHVVGPRPSQPSAQDRTCNGPGEGESVQVDLRLQSSSLASSDRPAGAQSRGDGGPNCRVATGDDRSGTFVRAIGPLARSNRCGWL